MALDIVIQYLKVLKKDPTAKKPEIVQKAEEMLGEDVVQELVQKNN